MLTPFRTTGRLRTIAALAAILFGVFVLAANTPHGHGTPPPAKSAAAGTVLAAPGVTAAGTSCPLCERLTLPQLPASWVRLALAPILYGLLAFAPLLTLLLSAPSPLRSARAPPVLTSP